MSTMKPLVSVLLPTYNQESFVAEAIESALNQELADIEIIVGDDCSQDGTWAIIQDYQRRYPDKVKPFRNERNLGITANCNEILKRCTGKYIVFHAGDDVYLPGKIDRQAALMEKNPQCVLSYHDVEVFDSESGKTLHYWHRGEGSHKALQGSTEFMAKSLVKEGTVLMAALTVMARRDCIPRHGYDERIPIASDWLMWIEILAGAKGRVLYVDEVLARYRRHDSNITLAIKDSTELYMTLSIVEARYPRLLGSVRRGRARLYFIDAARRIINNNYRDGRRFLVHGFLEAMGCHKCLLWWGYSWVKQLGIWEYRKK